MKSKVFSVFDDAVKSYCQPFFCASSRDAIYSFRELIKDERTTVHKSPADFFLFELGEFDDQTGVVTNLPVPSNLGSALVLMEKDSHAISNATPVLSSSPRRNSKKSVQPVSRA